MGVGVTSAILEIRMNRDKLMCQFNRQTPCGFNPEIVTNPCLVGRKENPEQIKHSEENQFTSALGDRIVGINAFGHNRLIKLLEPIVLHVQPPMGQFRQSLWCQARD